MRIESIKSLVEMANAKKTKVGNIVSEMQAEKEGVSIDVVLDRMDSYYQVMKESVENGIKADFDFQTGLQNDIVSVSDKYFNSKKTILGANLGKLITSAMAVSGYNASMGRIMAAPTAGSCGIMPAVLTFCEDNGAKRSDIVLSMFTAAGFADIIAELATFAGSEGGCQAECGSASAMASASMAEILGGTPDECAHAFALTLSTILGLICDPIAGYVEVPCMNKNILGAVHAATFAELSLAGVKSIIPSDEVVLAMKDVGSKMHENFKETSLGGLATTPTGLEIKERLLNKK